MVLSQREDKRMYFSVHWCRDGDHVTDIFLQQEALTLYAAELGYPILFLWGHPKALLLGARERTLPCLLDSVRAAVREGYEVIVRPFGGLLVPLDVGVLNVTWITHETLSIEDGFWKITKFLQHVCRASGDLQVGEVQGSYCPGRFDLSIQGRKIAGIAQRKVRQATAISAFVNVYSQGIQREKIIRDFYETALCKIDPPPWLPNILEGTVGSLFALPTVNDSVDSMDFFIQQCLSAMNFPDTTLYEISSIPHTMMEEAKLRLYGRLELF